MFLIGFTKNLENGAQNGAPIYFQTLKIFKFEVEIEPFVAGFIDLQIYSVELRFGAPFFSIFEKYEMSAFTGKKINVIAHFENILVSFENTFCK